MVFDVVVAANFDVLKEAGLLIFKAAAVEHDLLMARLVSHEVDLDAETLQGLVVVALLVQINTQLVDLALCAAVRIEQLVSQLFDLLSDVGYDGHRILLPEDKVN